MENLTLAVILLLPLFLTYFWRSNAAIFFLSVCAGGILVTQVSPELKNALGERASSLSFDAVSIGLLSIPPILSLLLARGSHQRDIKSLPFWLAAVAALGGSALYILLAHPLANGTGVNLNNSRVWSDLNKIRAEVVGAGAAASFLIVWLSGLSRGKHHK